MAEAVASRFSPSFRLVNAHFGLGVAGLLAFAAALVLRAGAVTGHHFQPVLLGLVHLCVLGWLLPVAFGALHQLVPVVFEAPVRSERLAWVAFALYVPGAAALTGHLATFATGPGLVLGAGLLLAAILLYVVNLLATIASARDVTLTGIHVIAALLFLLLAASLGFALAWNLHAPFLLADHLRWLKAHAYAATIGFFGLLIMGVAYQLLEMFLLSHGARRTAGVVALGATGVAVVAGVTNLVLGSTPGLGAVAVAGAVAGAAAFAVQVAAIFRRRARRRTDVAFRHSAASVAYLVLAVAVGAGLASAAVEGPWRERLELACGLLAIPGFIGSIVVGQLSKIVPFLVWYHRFSPYVGLKRVPAAADLLGQGPQRVQWALMHAGIAALLAGTLADLAPLRLAGAGAFAASAALFARNLAVVYRSRP